MTIELSLRRRAKQSRYLSLLWLTFMIAILVGTYISIPSIASNTLHVVSGTLNSDNNVTNLPMGKSAVYFAIVIFAFALAAILFACFFLGRTAFMELESAARSNALADALCIADDNLDDFEKAAALLVPKGKYFAITDVLSRKGREEFVEILKCLRKGV